MKVAVVAAVIAAVGVISVPAFAQSQYPGTGWNNVSTASPSNNISGMSTVNNGSNGRMGAASRRDRVDDAVYQDRVALKEIKKKLKEATTDEERAALLDQKRQLEADIVALQQS